MILLNVVLLPAIVLSGMIAGVARMPGVCESAVGSVFDAWGRFTEGGDADVLVPAFHSAGPQHRALEAEQDRFADGTETLGFETLDVSTRSVSAEAAVVTVEVVVEKEGRIPGEFTWDLEFLRDESGCVLWTVIPAGDSQLASREPPPANSGDSQPNSSDPVAEATVPRASPRVLDSPGETKGGVRLPAAAAWAIVLTLAGVAAAGYLAPRLDRKHS